MTLRTRAGQGGSAWPQAPYGVRVNDQDTFRLERNDGAPSSGIEIVRSCPAVTAGVAELEQVVPVFATVVHVSVEFAPAMRTVTVKE